MIKIDIRERLKLESKGHSFYNIRQEKYKSNDLDGINFRVSPTPFKLSLTQKKMLEDIGKAICDYMDCCIELYNTNETAHLLLDKGKPTIYKNAENIKYLFLRPDLILTDSGFRICEIETSPFGLGLAEVLNRTYGNEGYDTIVQQNQLRNYIHSNVENEGTIAYSEKVKAFSGQLDFMAEHLFSGNGKLWKPKLITSDPIPTKQIYRSFYLTDQFNDPNVYNLLTEPHIYLPTTTPQFEEKALLSFIWDKRYVDFFRNFLGTSTFELLRQVIPKTWILGEEKYVDGGLPNNFTSSIQLSELGKSSRKFVLKQSGFSSNSSWSEGVKFLHKMSGSKASEALLSASKDKTHLYIIQEFSQAKNVPMSFIMTNGLLQNLNAKIRITPYYAYTGNAKGSLIAAKVTGCENTEYIHASTASINTAVSYERN